MALTILGNLDGLILGVPDPETGIGVNSEEYRVFPKVNKEHEDNLGEVDGRVVSTVPSTELTIDGELTATSGGVLSADFITPFTPNNTLPFWGGGAGDFFMQEANLSYKRADWATVRCRFLADPNLSAGS